MFKQHFKQAFHLLLENKLLSAISIAGTALAISVVMNRKQTVIVRCM